MQLAEPMQLATVEVQETVGKGSVEVAKGAAKRAAVVAPADCPQARLGGSWVVAALADTHVRNTSPVSRSS